MMDFSTISNFEHRKTGMKLGTIFILMSDFT